MEGTAFSSARSEAPTTEPAADALAAEQDRVGELIVVGAGVGDRHVGRAHGAAEPTVLTLPGPNWKNGWPNRELSTCSGLPIVGTS